MCFVAAAVSAAYVALVVSNELPDHVYRRLTRQIGPIIEPVMLVPPPLHVTETLLPGSSVRPAVDAVVVHPLRLGREPTDRRGAVSDRLTRVPGVWLGNQWPVVIAAVLQGEPEDAIAFDQILLRRGERDFELWLLAQRLHHSRLVSRWARSSRSETSIKRRPSESHPVKPAD